MRFKDRKNLTVELIDEFNKIIYHLSYFFSFQLSEVSTMFLTPRLADTTGRLIQPNPRNNLRNKTFELLLKLKHLLQYSS